MVDTSRYRKLLLSTLHSWRNHWRKWCNIEFVGSFLLFWCCDLFYFLFVYLNIYNTMTRSRPKCRHNRDTDCWIFRDNLICFIFCTLYFNNSSFYCTSQNKITYYVFCCQCLIFKNYKPKLDNLPVNVSFTRPFINNCVNLTIWLRKARLLQNS